MKFIVMQTFVISKNGYFNLVKTEKKSDSIEFGIMIQ